jgi:hypothetical protein
MGIHMKILSNKVLGLAMSAGALIAAVGLGVQTGDFASHVQAASDAPVHYSPEPPSPPPPPPPPAMTQAPNNDDYWTGQGSAGGAPGGAGGGG